MKSVFKYSSKCNLDLTDDYLMFVKSIDKKCLEREDEKMWMPIDRGKLGECKWNEKKFHYQTFREWKNWISNQSKKIINESYMPWII